MSEIEQKKEQDNKKEKKVVTRFPPSPTGFIHVGGVRTALFAFAFARKNKGTFILRIEDTDKEREVPGSIEHIIKSLKWLGLEWDEGVDIGGPNTPYIQSQRLQTYQDYAKKLIEKNLAYADPYTEEEIEKLREQAKVEKRPYLYRDYRPENPPVWDGSKPLRLKIKEIKEYKWHDEARGDLSAGPEALDDFILIKSDGYPTYNFAHIVDDDLMGVTHVMRADEFISSTPKFLALYDALDIIPPKLVTLPPIMGPDGKRKLGKRDGAKDILDYEKEGILPDAMLNFLALIGWNPGTEQEIFSKEEFINAFDINKIQTAGAKFNEEKLLWFNKEYIKKEPSENILREIKARIPEKYNDEKILLKLVPIIKDRISKYSEIEEMVKEGEIDYYFETPKIIKENLICPPKLRKDIPVNFDEIKVHLEYIVSRLSEISDENFNLEAVKNTIWDYATEKGRGVVLWAMRYALSGKEKSPDPFSMSDILGKQETIKRLNEAMQL